MTSCALSLEAEASIAYALEHCFSQMWEEVEFNMGRNIAVFYTDDALLRIGSGMELRGIREIEAFYAYRRDLGGRVSRHLATNYRFDFSTYIQNGRVRVLTIVTHYGDSGPQPLQSALPLGIYDSELIFERQSDSSWRIARYLGGLFFLNADNPYWSLPKHMNPMTRSDP